MSSAKSNKNIKRKRTQFEQPQKKPLKIKQQHRQKTPKTETKYRNKKGKSLKSNLFREKKVLKINLCYRNSKQNVCTLCSLASSFLAKVALMFSLFCLFFFSARKKLSSGNNCHLSVLMLLSCLFLLSLFIFINSLLLFVSKI